MESIDTASPEVVSVARALDNGDLDLLRQAVETHGLDENLTEVHLRRAVILNRPDLMEVICPDQDVLGKHLNYMLLTAARARADKSFNYLAKRITDTEDTWMALALEIVAKTGQVECTRSILQAYQSIAGRQPGRGNYFVLRHLESGVESGKSDIVRLLLDAVVAHDQHAIENGGPVAQDQAYLDHAFNKAVMAGNFEIMDILKHAGAEINGKGRVKPPLEWGVISGKIEIVQYLLDMKAKPEPYMIEMAESCGHDDIAGLLRHAIPSKPLKRTRKRC